MAEYRFNMTAEDIERRLSTMPEKGDPGTSVTITDMEVSTESGGTNTVWFSDGKTLEIQNGKDGETGGQGEPGAQGPRGVQGETGKSAYQYAKDNGYTGTEAEFTEDINPNNIKAELSQIEAPKIVSSVEEMTDTTKHYALDGYIYYNKTITTQGEKTYPNLYKSYPDGLNKRLSGSSGSTSSKNGYFVLDLIAVKDLEGNSPYTFDDFGSASSYYVRLNWEMPTVASVTDDTKVIYYNSAGAKIGYCFLLSTTGNNVTVSNGETVIDIRKFITAGGSSEPNWADVAYVKLQLALNTSGAALTTADLANCEITFDGIYEETQGGTKQEWVNSGISYAPTFKTDLIGVLGEDNVIYLSDNLPSGTYTLKYPDNNYATVGTITK